MGHHPLAQDMGLVPSLGRQRMGLVPSLGPGDETSPIPWAAGDETSPISWRRNSTISRLATESDTAQVETAQVETAQVGIAKSEINESGTAQAVWVMNPSPKEDKKEMTPGQRAKPPQPRGLV